MPVKPGRKIMRAPTPDSLAEAALRYLSRYAASEQSVRRVLTNRLRRVSITNPAFAADTELHAKLHQAIDAIIARHKKTGTLNDASFAEMKIHSLRRAGRSRRAIMQKLTQKGVKAATITASLDQADDPEAAEINAARQLAKRRRLGCFRQGDTSPDQARKDLTAMARAGFSIAIARQVLQTNRDDDEDENYDEVL